MKRIQVLFGLICTVVTMTAQVGVEAKIDSIQMLIGQQVHVTVTATTPSNAKVVFPSFKSRDTLVAGVEVLNISKEEKEELEQGQQQISRVYTLTSFDGKLYYLPPFQVKVDGKTYQSKSLALKVLEVEVDTTNLNQYYGPKDVQNNPFLWSDWSTAFWLSVLILLLMAVAYYLYLRLRDNKPIIKSFKIVKRLLPHQKAMKEIEQIKADKMVSSENQKEYYTKLTDTLRRYIEERYKFSAMEMTSSEIIERLTQDGDQKSLDELRELFTTADLVKFAKYSTLINENDKNLVSAIEFINQTKQELQVVEEEKPQLSEADQRSLKTRRILKWTIGSIIVVSVVLIGYVIYRLMILTEFI
ncbi:MAG: hypothetical protein J6Y46_02440 [Prevotella sp.]|nr:hypothetical protein [Prevotella sp.]